MHPLSKRLPRSQREKDWTPALTVFTFQGGNWMLRHFGKVI